MNNLIWFRNNLRVADNTAIATACTGEKVIAVYCFDPRHFQKDIFGFKKTEKYRAQFLIETVANLKKNLRQLNIALVVCHEQPEIALPKLVHKHEIKNIFLQKEWTSEENTVFDAVVTNAPASINFESTYNQFLYHPDDIPYDNLGQLPDVYTNFRKK